MAKNPDSREWNAEVYHQISAPQVSWGKKVLARISLRGNETVLDAGCGTGRLTRELLEALPHGQVVALDLSQNMLDAARAYLEPDFGGRVEFVCGDLVEHAIRAEIRRHLQRRVVSLGARSRPSVSQPASSASTRWLATRAVRREKQSATIPGAREQAYDNAALHPILRGILRPLGIFGCQDSGGAHGQRRLRRNRDKSRRSSYAVSEWARIPAVCRECGIAAPS